LINKKAKQLVVDASVARASGGSDAVHPTAASARNFLKKVLDCSHKAVMTPAILEEWNAHQSKFARSWRKSMVARKILVVTDVVEYQGIRAKVEVSKNLDVHKAAMIKDCHLIDAAMATDKQIISLDDTARGLFAGVAEDFPSIGDVLWINPVERIERVGLWLEGSNKCEEWRLLQTD